MKKALLILLVGGTLSAATFLVFFIDKKSWRSRSTETVLKLHAINMNIDMLLENNGAKILSITNSDSITMNRSLSSLLLNQTNELFDIHKFASKDGLFIDSWGTPLIFMATNSSNFSLVNPRLHGKARPFVVWSAGPDKTNNFGNVDDVFTDY